MFGYNDTWYLNVVKTCPNHVPQKERSLIWPGIYIYRERERERVCAIMKVLKYLII
jgi:hypothetical protein